jgi:2,5-diketo-D-gluconate reductase B
MNVAAKLRPVVSGSLPLIGFGTYGMERGPMLRMIPAALTGGFRHIDTAQVYRNEAEVGECLAASEIPRAEVFLTTKVWVANYGEPLFERSVDASLRALRTDYIDLLLLHWPGGSPVPLADQIGSLNQAWESGRARYIGVSNFNAALMAEAARLSKHPLATNQVEYHPYLNQTVLLEAARKLGISITAYCAMAVGRVFDDPVLQQIARQRGRTVSQVVLRWLIQQEGVVALSRTTNLSRIAENLAIFDFPLSDEEMAAIHARAAQGSRIVSPPGLSPVWDPTPPAKASVAA